jgi:hypothetical protein
MRPQGPCADVDLAQGVRVLGQRVSLTPQWLPQPISLKNLAALRQFSGANSGYLRFGNASRIKICPSQSTGKQGKECKRTCANLFSLRSLSPLGRGPRLLIVTEFDPAQGEFSTDE